MFLKLYEEVSEIVANPGSADEIADVIIMLLDHASRHNINAAHAVLLKLSINLRRSWNTDGMVAKHIKDDQT
jgi:hypothetical protein